MHTIVETDRYVYKAEKLLSEPERDLVIETISADPLVGVLMSGAAGLRKVRFGKGSRGKSGGVRVVYYYYDGTMPCLLMTIFGKNEKDNLSKAERNALSAVVAEIKHEWRRKLQ